MYLRNLLYKIKRLIAWIPVVWNDRDWDWAFLARIMEFKLRRMSKLFEQTGSHVRAKKDARRMLICAILLKRIYTDDYLDQSYNREEERRKYDEWYLFELMRKHMRGWWD